MEPEQQTETKANGEGSEMREEGSEMRGEGSEMRVSPGVPLTLPHQTDQWEFIKETLENTISVEDSAEYEGLVKKLNNNIRYLSIPVPEVYPILRKLVLELPSLFPPTEAVEYLLMDQEATIYLSRRQVACLLACSVLGLFESRYFRRPPGRSFPHFDISRLPLKQFMNCIVCYFKTIDQKMPEGHISITRKVLREEQYPAYEKSQKPLGEVIPTHDVIESYYQHRLHADFANKYIGGGVLQGGNVQEEILFVIKPECLVSLLFCEMMEINEAIIITGAEQFSKYTGYGGRMRFDGEFKNTTETFTDSSGRVFIRNSIVAFDANVAFGSNQFHIDIMNRDINKAYIALRGENQSPQEYFVTGNWGCGVFGGDKQLKAVQQIIAASEAGVNLIYSAFNDEAFKTKLQEFVDFLKKINVRVGDLYQSLVSYQDNDLTVFEHITQKLQSKAAALLTPQTTVLPPLKQQHPHPEETTQPIIQDTNITKESPEDQPIPHKQT